MISEGERYMVVKQTLRGVACDFLKAANNLAMEGKRDHAAVLVSAARHCLIRSLDVDEDDASDDLTLLEVAQQPVTP